MNSLSRIRGASQWTVLVWCITAVYGLYFSVRTVGIHQGLGTSAYDFALYDQGIWLLSRGESPFVTLMGRNLFGDHSSLILLFLVPIYWVVGSTTVLFIVQSVVIALGAIPVYLFSRTQLRSDSLGALFAVLYLLHPAISWTNLENFHPDSVLGVLVATTVWAATARRWSWYWVAVMLALLVKEDVAFVLAPIGIWVFLYQNRKYGVITSIVSFVAMVMMFVVVMRGFTGVTFRNSWRIPFGGIRGLLQTVFTKPLTFVRYIVSDERPIYVWQMLSPMAFVFLYSPSLALVGSVMFASNIVSTFAYQHQVQYHYSMIIVPCVVMGTVWALGRMDRSVMHKAVAVVAVASVTAAYFWSPLPGAASTTRHWSAASTPVVAAREAMDVIPSDAVVSAYHSLSAHLARRQQIYAFPNPFQRSNYGVNVFAKGDRLPEANLVEYVILPAQIDDGAKLVWNAEAAMFVEVFRNAWWVVFKQR